jgi:hypothetical protein
VEGVGMSAVRQALLLSSGRSGSTLLDRLLGRHSQVASLGEVMQWPKNQALDTMCTCGEPMSRCVFWQSVSERLKASMAADVNAHPYALDMGLIGATRVRDASYYTPRRVMHNKMAQAVLWAGQRLGRYWPLPLVHRQGRHSLAVYDAVRTAADVACVVDSSKQYLRGIGVYQQSPHDTRLIVLVRDGRAVLHSRMQSGVSIEEAVHRWVRYYQRMLPCLRASVPDTAVFRVRYEQLASDPNAVLAALFDFLDLPAAGDVLGLADADVHMVEGNAMRFEPLTSVRLDRRWEQALSASARRYFERHAGAMNRELGYDSD